MITVFLPDETTRKYPKGAISIVINLSLTTSIWPNGWSVLLCITVYYCVLLCITLYYCVLLCITYQAANNGPSDSSVRYAARSR